ncbi:MAG TPA: right-handed parallel beta-helix repeat-containing protein [Bryobacteraceae bacterium]|nr:right-handed parallel beta-helix repeat-containing protein [Bryobacteraceae bacterium]
MTRLNTCLAALAAIGLAPAATAQLTRFEVIDHPGAAATFAYGINNAGDITGSYFMADQKRHGFLRRGGQFTTIDVPGASATWPYRINNAGDIAGVYSDSSNKQHGFLLRDGTFRTIDFPGADQTMIYGLNSAGDVTGMYFANGDTSKHYGWAMISGRFVTIDHPLSNDMSCGTWIGDSGEVAGHVQEKNGKYRGYVWKEGKFTLFEIEGGQKWTFWDGPAEINAAGDILGTYTDARGKQRGFFLHKGAFTTFDVPGAQSMRASAMNNSGQVVGLFTDSAGVSHGFFARVAPVAPTQLLMVDDDGADCPGALHTIQEAVAQASAGATILVCPGIYQKMVKIAGPEKNGLQLIAIGRAGEVVLQGDYSERDGIHLKDVTDVLVRGFTVRDFGRQPTTETAWGDGKNIHLENAHYNTIENNRLINGDMMGIHLNDSGNNTVQFNMMFVDNSSLANCGIHVSGARAENNVLRQNWTHSNKMAGIMLSGAGTGNIVVDNVLNNNGRQGILNSNTAGTWIEGNRISYNRGPWGTSPYGKDLLGLGIGILLQNSEKVSILDNRLRNNTGGDLNWDGKGENRVEANACDSSTPASVCGR